MREQKPVKHFSMIRSFHFADLLTIANGFCGIGAIFEAMKFLNTHDSKHIYFATLLVPLALIFDVLDGRIARWRHSSSSLGKELDSLADLISFGVAPASIAFSAGLDTHLDQFILMYFALCGLARLARYNVTAESLSIQTGKVEYFEGTPIPASFIPLSLLMFFFYRENLFLTSLIGVRFHWPVWMFFISGCLMISKTLKIPKP